MKAENDHLVYHDTDILTAFREAPGTHIIFAVDALMAGIDLPNVQDIIALRLKLLMSYCRGLGEDTKKRVVVHSRGIVYVTHKRHCSLNLRHLPDTCSSFSRPAYRFANGCTPLQGLST